jgi:hypothetical protein
VLILDRSRINVAISRAQCLAIVVADLRIASTAAGQNGSLPQESLLAHVLECSKWTVVFVYVQNNVDCHFDLTIIRSYPQMKEGFS